MIGRRRYSGGGRQDAAFEVLDGNQSRVVGSLHYTTARALLAEGAAAITDGRAAVIDLAGVTATDSAGLALLIEWLSIARAAGKSLQLQNIHTQIHQLARLSEVEELLGPA